MKIVQKIERVLPGEAFGEFSNTGGREFTRPDQDETLDWVLVLDDAAAVPSYANQFTKP